ncbi:protein ACCELERATED CELL DEATH 6-like [Neltuma alba]|uniref:protein ACCELERATED CELL DEATH 6-like n=1 Tax=Neltuma alba TaxID=207710 RepID=UPI0010A32BAD|nr:protein ACCELERATED CELL DEATH 6-like [Prosopis alba]
MEKHFMLTFDVDEEEEAVSMDNVEFIMLRNNYGMTALHEAVLSKDSSVVCFLLSVDKQSDITTYCTWNYDYGCKSPMYLAAPTSVREVLHPLLDIPIPSGKDISNGDSPLHAAFLADAILEDVGVSLKANMLAIQRITSTNKEWNVKDAANTLIFVVILIATVTFTAGFTIPGGFYSSDGPIPKQRGLALLADQTLFKIFMAFNTIAMNSSTIGSVILLWVPLGDLRFAQGVYGLPKIFVYVALIAMPVAFLAAVRLIVSNNTLLADFIIVIGFISIFFIIFVRMLGFCPLRNRRPVFRQIAGLLIRIIIVLFYGWSDIVDQAVGEVDVARNEFGLDGIDIYPDDHIPNNFSHTDGNVQVLPMLLVP